MQYRNLGKSGLKVSELSFGTWLTFGKQIEDNVAEQLMIKAYEAGVNFFDNAESYQGGQSEIVMGKILKKCNWRRSSYLVSSKVMFGGEHKGINEIGLSKKHVFEACNDALKRLQVEYLDLYYCHRPDKSTPIEETVWAMHQLVMTGKILYWGTSEWSAQEIMEAHEICSKHNLVKPTMEQPQYNMFHRQRFEIEYAQLYKNYGLGTTIWSPLASGLLSGKYNEGKVADDTRFRTYKTLAWLEAANLTKDKIEKVKKIGKIADDCGVSTAQLALLWCLQHPNVSTVILGASKLAQLEENLKAVELRDKIDDKIYVKIEKILNNKPEKPQF